MNSSISEQLSIIYAASSPVRSNFFHIKSIALQMETKSGLHSVLWDLVIIRLTMFNLQNITFSSLSSNESYINTSRTTVSNCL